MTDPPERTRRDDDATAANKELLRRNIEELWGKGDVSLVPELFAPDAVDYMPVPGQRPGHEGLAEVVRAFHRAFPDLEMALEGLVAEGDRVVDHWVFRGTHTGELFGISPTGRRVEFRGIDVARVADGRIVEFWHVEEMLQMMRQLGYEPERNQP